VLQRPEGNRTYSVWVPSSYNEADPTSLVFALHGLGDHAVHFAQRANFTNKSEEIGFLGIYPQGSTGAIGTAWDAGTCCVLFIDDPGFLRNLVEIMNATFNIRPESIHSFGFSNGGFMTERLGCEMADIFTSIASVSGGTILEPGNAGGLQQCDKDFQAGSPTSILHVHGNLDFVVPWDGDVVLGFPSVPDNMAAWVARNHCPNPPVQTFNISTFSNQIWSGCQTGISGSLVQVELVKNEGGGHVFSNGSNNI